jgi:hypothetical protein
MILLCCVKNKNKYFDMFSNNKILLKTTIRMIKISGLNITYLRIKSPCPKYNINLVFKPKLPFQSTKIKRKKNKI